MRPDKVAKKKDKRESVYLAMNVRRLDRNPGTINGRDIIKRQVTFSNTN